MLLSSFLLTPKDCDAFGLNEKSAMLSGYFYYFYIKNKMQKLLIYNATIVNEGIIFKASLVIEKCKIISIKKNIKIAEYADYEFFDATGKYILPGIIDTHVHFRDPGMPEKGDIYTESRAAAAGGITTFFDMPNTIPQTIDANTLKEKFKIAEKKSLINYSFFIGATNDNLPYLSTIERQKIPGIKLFYASSTGNMLMDRISSVEKLFSQAKIPIVVHSEKNSIINKNMELFKQKYGEDIPSEKHAEIRSAQSCIIATKELYKLAQKHNTKLHFLHITTAQEVKLFEKNKNKNITAEVSPNHLYFDSLDYKKLGNLIKCNPSIKSETHRAALLQGLKSDFINSVATDHAPHTLAQKQNRYINAPSGIPSIQHSLNIMLEFVHSGVLSIEKTVEKMCHNPALIFGIKNRGFIRENYFADLTIVDLQAETHVSRQSLLYKCQWSPLEGKTFNSKIIATLVNGHFVFKKGKIIENKISMPVEFDR